MHPLQDIDSISIVAPEAVLTLPHGLTFIFVGALMLIILMAGFIAIYQTGVATNIASITLAAAVVSLMALIITSFILGLQEKGVWNTETAQLVGEPYTPKDLQRVGLFNAVRSGEVTTITTNTTAAGATKIHVDGRAVTITPTPPDKIFEEELTKLCTNTPAGISPLSTDACSLLH